MNYLTIAKYVGEGLLVYTTVGFFVASLVTKFEKPTNYESQNARWCGRVDGFLWLWFLWPLLGSLVLVEQICVSIAGHKNLLVNYIKWLRRELPSKNRGIEA